MKKIVTLSVLTLFFYSCSITKLLTPSTFETISAVREVMNNSAVRAIAKLSKLATDNPSEALPKEIQPVLATLKTLGFESEIAKATKVIGDVSAVGMVESKALFADAIKEVDLGDAASIVLGGEDAASQVLKNNMKLAVRKRYATKINEQLNAQDVNKYWPLAAGAYNIFAKNKVDSDLSTFLADRAVDAVFLAMGHEERAIRKDVKSLGSQTVNKVFEYYKQRGKI